MLSQTPWITKLLCYTIYVQRFHTLALLENNKCQLFARLCARYWGCDTKHGFWPHGAISLAKRQISNYKTLASTGNKRRLMRVYGRALLTERLQRLSRETETWRLRQWFTGEILFRWTKHLQRKCDVTHKFKQVHSGWWEGVNHTLWFRCIHKNFTCLKQPSNS